MTAASSAYAKVPPELLPTPAISAEALWLVEMPPGLDTSMVTSRTIRLPLSTVSTAEILLTVPFRVSKVLSRVTEAVWPREKPAASSAGKGTVRLITSELRMVATVWPADTSSPTSTSRAITRPEAVAVTFRSSWFLSLLL